MKKLTVAGAGISGLSVARMLSPFYQTEIWEAAPKIGGLVKCERIGGNLFHRVGGHVFNSKNVAVLDWFWQHFNRDEEFLLARRNAKIFLGGRLIGYPLENHLYQLPEPLVRQITGELLATLQCGGPAVGPANFRDFLLQRFGATLYEIYFGPYNSKIWSTDISHVPLGWLDGKLPMPDLEEVLVSNIVKRPEEGMVHARFYYPKQNGSQFIIDRLAEGLSISVSKPLSDVKVSANGQLLLNGASAVSDALVYCGDVRKLAAIVRIDDDGLQRALAEVKDLPSNGTSNMLCETDCNELSWLYLPEPAFKAHRIIYTGNFSETNNAGKARSTCVVEFSGQHSEENMVEELGRLPGNLKPLAFNYEPNSYVIQHADTRARIERLKQALSPYKIYLLGRFAEWEYHNMDKCIESAMMLSAKLRGSAQTTPHEKSSVTHDGAGA